MKVVKNIGRLENYKKALEYKECRNFKLVIDKAIISCDNSNFNVFDHFVQSDKIVEIGSGAKRK